MPAQWKVGADDVWYIVDFDDKGNGLSDTGVRLTARRAGLGRLWRYSLNIGKHWVKPVPAHMQGLSLEELQAWVMAMWRMQ